MPVDHSNTVQNYLTQCRYRNHDKTKKDILNALHHYRGLQPKLEKFTFNDGSQRDLVTLDGTIPVPYRGQNYNIPIAVFLLDTHPFHAPMCYVRPTPDMQIRVSRHVDHTGKIYLPYLHEWNQANSGLLGLVQICIMTFGEQPPVYARPRQAGPPPAATSTPPPYPAAVSQFYPPTSGGGYPPPYPPSSAGNAMPPYPPVSNGNAAGYPPYPPSTSNSYMPPAAQYTPPTGQNPAYGSSYQQTQYQTQNSSEPNSGTITQEHIRASLLSAVEDKVRRHLREEFAIKQSEMESLRKIQDELTEGQTKLKSALAKLDHEETQLDANILTLTEKEEELRKAAELLQENESVDVDEAVVTTAPLYRQLLGAFAEEAAIDDAIYYLGEALRRGVISCDVFLKYVRNLSRKQFLLRATMQKCRQKAGLTI